MKILLNPWYSEELVSVPVPLEYKYAKSTQLYTWQRMTIRVGIMVLISEGNSEHVAHA